MTRGSSALLVLCACGGVDTTAAAEDAGFRARDEAVVLVAIATRDGERIENYLASHPDGPNAAQARAALAELVPIGLARYRATASALATPPHLVLAMLEILESVATGTRKVPWSFEASGAPPTGDTPEDGHLRDAIAGAEDQFRLWAGGDQGNTLRHVTRGAFSDAEVPAPPGTDGPHVAMTRVVEPTGAYALEGGGGMRGLQARIGITIRVPAHDGHPGRTVEHSEVVGLSSAFSFQWSEGAGTDGAANRASVFYREVLRQIAIQSALRFSILRATIRDPDTYADTFPIPRAMRAWDAVVVRAEGLPGIAPGDRCRLQMGEGEESQRCRTAVSCEGLVLYGAGTTGFATCPTEPGVLASDATPTSGDTDPAITARADTRTLSIRDEAGGALGAFALEATLEPFVAPP